MPQIDSDLDYAEISRQTPSNAELKKIAKQNPPPQWWLEGGEECPFK